MLNGMWRLAREWRLALVAVAAGAVFLTPVTGGAAGGVNAGTTVFVASDSDGGSGTDDTPWD
jgi:hypothetical protein